MAAKSPRHRGTAEPQVRKTVKASLVIDVDTHVRWAAAAAMRGQDRNQFAVLALREALRGIVVVDRNRKPTADIEAAGSGPDDDVAAE